jgi:hypothetical protein
MDWNTRIVITSQAHPEVDLILSRMTFGRRLELMRRVRDLAVKLEYFQAGTDERHRMEATIVAAEIDSLYVRWGVEEVRGLQIDGASATVEALIERGPEDLFLEALAAVRAQCGLGEAEVKN